MNSDRIANIAERIAKKENDLGFDVMAMEVAKWLSENPNPADSKFHDWAKSNDYEPDDAEAAAYRLASTFSTFLLEGRAAGKGITVDDVDPVELSMGIAIEMEHTTCRLIAMRIALDHLAELDDYYTRLKKMEEDAGIKE
jgi:hypothetical protein